MQATESAAPAPAEGHDMANMPAIGTTTEAPHGAAEGTTEHTSEPAHGEGGLPQFDIAQWPGQIAWFLIIFFVVFLLSRFVFVPKIGGTIDARDGKIDGDIAEARRLKSEADTAAEAAAAELASARASAQKVASDARTASAAESAAALAKEEAKLAETTSAAEARIAQARDKAMGNVATIASDTASAIVEHLTGTAASPAELAAGRA